MDLKAFKVWGNSVPCSTPHYEVFNVPHSSLPLSRIISTLINFPALAHLTNKCYLSEMFAFPTEQNLGAASNYRFHSSEAPKRVISGFVVTQAVLTTNSVVLHPELAFCFSDEQVWKRKPLAPAPFNLAACFCFATKSKKQYQASEE